MREESKKETGVFGPSRRETARLQTIDERKPQESEKGNRRYHGTVNLTLCSYRMATMASEASAQREWDDAFEPDPEAIYVHDNELANSGANPRGSLGVQLEALLGRPIPDIVLDGFQDPRKLVDGALPPALGLWFERNGEARFANLRLGAGGPPSRDITPHRGSLPRLAPVALAEDAE